MPLEPPSLAPYLCVHAADGDSGRRLRVLLQNGSTVAHSPLSESTHWWVDSQTAPPPCSRSRSLFSLSCCGQVRKSMKWARVWRSTVGVGFWSGKIHITVWCCSMVDASWAENDGPDLLSGLDSCPRAGACYPFFLWAALWLWANYFSVSGPSGRTWKCVRLLSWPMCALRHGSGQIHFWAKFI
jgi:hypothetical protein